MMSAVPKQILSPAEYLERDRIAEVRSEYYRGELFAMAGASRHHNFINDNLIRHLGNQLEHTDCRTASRDLRVKVSTTGFYAYPDAIIVCKESIFEDDIQDTLLNPRVLFEILSPTSERYDRGIKFAHYRQIESLQEYILIAQDRVLVERYVRQSNGDWRMTPLESINAELVLTSVPVRISLADLYRDVSFEEAADR